MTEEPEESVDTLVDPPTATALEGRSPEDWLGQVLCDCYRIDAVIARGGIGTVYRAEQLTLGRPVAVKLLRPPCVGSAHEARLRSEARIIAELHHPHIVTVHELATTASGDPFLVMEMLTGRTLKELLKQESLSPRRAMRIAAQILDALTVVHAAGVVHRDLKPANIFVIETQRHRDFAKLLDFGVASVSNRGDGEGSAPGTIVGSPRYLAPEQALGLPVTPRTDLYALGVVLYEMLTGRPPFMARDASECIVQHLRETPPPPMVDGVTLSGPIVDIVMQCLEKDPKSRPPSASAALALFASMEARTDTYRSLTGSRPADLAWERLDEEA